MFWKLLNWIFLTKLFFLVADDDLLSLSGDTGGVEGNILCHGDDHETPEVKTSQTERIRQFETSAKFAQLAEESFTDSELSSTSNSQPVGPSQGSSNFSTSSEAAADRRMEVFKRVLECINYMDPEIGEKMSRPLDLNVQSRTLQRYGDLVGRVLKKVLESLVMKNEIETEKQFLKIVLKHISAGSFQSNENTVELALNVLDSISDFYAIAAQDKSRTGISTRKLVLQAITGNKVQNSHQISLLSEIVGARYMTIFKEAENRKLLDEHQKLLPFIEMLRRKTPQGARFIPEKTRLDVIEFYERDHIREGFNKKNI